MHHSSSFVARALLALVLMVGFYLMALGIAAGLFYICYADVAYARHVNPKLVLLSFLGGGAILWSVFPRFDKFTPPGPRLTPERHPRLFEDVAKTAQAAGQEMPAEIYLVPDVNAWVTQRGGFMGFGSRRVMGLGLPLMRVLTCSQFRAVLAHEFGHYYGGDTRLGPWVYKTRSAIGRTLQTLSGEDGKGSFLQLPFFYYMKMFLRVTHAVSRRQEFVADELAARIAGAFALADGLRVVSGAAPAFSFYMSNECGPVLNAGFRPPLVEGFDQFMKADQISQFVAKQTEAELADEENDPYATHPPLRDRIAAIEHLPPGEIPETDEPAITLLDGIDELELEMLAEMGGSDSAAKLKPIPWNRVCEQVYLPIWSALVDKNGAFLSGLTPESLLEIAADPQSVAGRVVNASGKKPQPDEVEGLTSAILGAAITLLVRSKGGEAQMTPGMGISVKHGIVELDPFNLMRSLKDGSLTSEAWKEECAALGIAGEDLGRVPTMPVSHSA